MIYLTTLILGFISLKSQDDLIGDQYFSILELLIILLSPLMVFCMVIVHKSTPEKLKLYSLTALIFMSIIACITTCLHFVILSLSRQEVFSGQAWSSLVFSFTWPSIVYSIDILAWDFFFALSMLFLSSTFRKKGLERWIQFFLIISGILSLIGILGIPMNNMQVRNIGIAGYNGVAIPPATRYRQYLLSLDIDWTRIKTDSKILKVLLKGMTFVKLPFSALKYNTKGEFKGYYLYY